MNTAWIVLALNSLFSHEVVVKNHLESYYISLPVPVQEGKHSYMAVAFFEQSGPVAGSPLVLYKNMYLARVRYPDCLIQIRTVDPTMFGITATENEIGSIDRSHIGSVEEYVEAKRSYQELVSEIMENNWLSNKGPQSPREYEARKELRACWEILKEDKLMPFYRQAGGQLLKWMN